MTKQEKQKFIEEFNSLTPLEQFEKYIETTGFDNKTEAGKIDIYTACAILINKEELVKFLKKQKIKMIDGWDDIDAIMAVADHFEVHPAVARYRMLSVWKLSLVKDENVCAK